MDRYQKSREYLERARKVIPGAAQTLSKMPARFPQGAFPVTVTHGIGANLFDVDHNEYVDWIGALGAIPLGYSNDNVVGAVTAQISKGSALSLPHETELELSERLCSKIPCAEMVRFVNSGSESTEAAVRTARIATGRDIILTVKDGYNGWFAWFQAVKDWHPGVPLLYEDMVGTFRYNDLDSLKIAFRIHEKNDWQLDRDSLLNPGVAAVIMEPCLFEKPNEGFLQGVRDLCTKNGALLIFDEMVTGYRWALAGGQEYFGVTPDLATFGKGMANGLPIGMLCGKREYMQHAELISGTFGGNAVSLAAANAVLNVYEQEPVIETMWKRGQELKGMFTLGAFTRKINAIAEGYDCKPRFKFNLAEKSDLAMSLFLQETAAHGALFHYGGMNVCYALTDEDMITTKKAIDIALDAIEVAIRENDWSSLKGDIIKPVVTVRK